MAKIFQHRWMFSVIRLSLHFYDINIAKASLKCNIIGRIRRFAMKMMLLSALIAGTISVAAQANTGAVGEISYPKGSIGYEALMRGDNERAVAQILASEQVSKHDPAKLLNLGRAYARMGQTEQAAGYFKAAMQARESVDLVLADGRVMNSKVAARKSFANLQTRVATR
jgi:tetratricopeptide (TPR) repeat protein